MTSRTPHTLALQQSEAGLTLQSKQHHNAENEAGAEQLVLVAVLAVNGALAVVAVALPAAAEVGERTSG